MNLHGIASGMIATVNPMLAAELRISTGSAEAYGGKLVPAYEAPGAFVGSIAADVLTVTSRSAGKIAVGQSVLGAGVVAGTTISGFGTGTGALGTYSVSIPQSVASEAMTTKLTVSAQVQALTFRDLQQIDGLNLNGTRRGIYLYGKVQGVNRAENKGGDLVVIAAGPNAGVWLVAQVLETWQDWCKVAVTQQLYG